MAGKLIDDDMYAGLAEAKKDESQAQFDDIKVHPVKDHLQTVSSDDSNELDGIHDGLEFPTDEELETLRRVPDQVPWTAYLIAFVEAAERFSYYGATVVFVNFIQQPLPSGSKTGAGFSGQSGALGLGQRASTGITTFNSFWVYIIPLFGAYVADTYLGRFKTICWAVAIALLGHILLVISSIPGIIDKHEAALAIFIIAIIIMGIGTGGFKANISPLVAEQYRRTKPFINTTTKGERVVVDPVLTVSRIYMYFYLFINIGSLVGQIGMSFSEKYVGFWLAYLLPTVVFMFCPLVLWLGHNRYTRSPPSGSILGTAFKAWRFAMKGRWSWNPAKTHRQMTAPDFWESTKPSNIREDKRPSWMTFDDVWVDELKRGFKACSVFLWYPVYWLTYNQMTNNLTSQAATMVTNGVPNDVLSNLDPIALIIFIPICDIFMYPALRRAGINFSPIKKIAFGFWIGALAMAYAAVVQHYIYQRNPCGEYVTTCEDADGNPVTADLNVWIQTGSYILIAFSEIFASITGLEYAFTKAPKNMRSLVMSMFLFMTALSSAIGEAFVSLSTDPLLVWNYSVFGVMAFVSGCVFWFQYRHLDRAEDELNNIAEGHAVAAKFDEEKV